uniref:Nuclear pore complex protein Nup160 n=1 Tax=Panagrolaimus sp. JU765 TaxID=591449 RepID=A0AC34QPA2_9BILA
MDCFDPCELVFNRTYFAKKYPRTLKIQGDAHISGFSNVDVPASSGSFSFSKTNLGFENRFMLWRAEGSNLYLDEYSVDRVLRDAAICINFGHSIIIPGTRLFTHCGMLLLFVPTQAAIHRIMVRIARDDLAASQKSILSCFPREEDLALHWDCRHFATNGTAKKAEINLNGTGLAYLSFIFLDGQLVLLEFPFQQPPDILRENILQENRRLTTLIWKNANDNLPVMDVCSAVNGENVIFFAIHRDGKIRVWSAFERRNLYTTELSSVLMVPDKIRAETYSIKLAMVEDASPVVVVLSQMPNEAQFYFLQWKYDFKTGFDVQFANTLNGKHILDYVVVHGKEEKELYNLWVITREAYDPKSLTTTFQPYLLWKLPVLSTKKGNWERISPAVNDQSIDELSFAFPSTLNAIKHRIFNGESYSFDVVTRAIQIVCKRGPVLPQVYNNWSALMNYVDEYISSGHFIQSHFNSEEQSSLYVLNMVNASTSKETILKFYEALLHHCDDFQEAGLQPLGLWYCNSLDLIGVVQQCRFTVHHKGDLQMQQIINTAENKEILKKSLDAAHNFLKNGESAKGMSKEEQISLLSMLVNNDEEICNVIRLFAEHCPIDEVKMNTSQGEYVESAFTTGLLSIIFRHRLLRRSKFARLICGIANLVPELSRQAKTTTHDIWASITQTHGSSMQQIANNYRIMWTILSLRLTKHVHRPSDDVSQRLTVCQAFFQFGGSLVKRLNTLGDNLVTEDEDSSDNDSNNPPVPVGETEYEVFIREVVDGASVSLWPESTSLTLPLFLAEKGFSEALSRYCYENDPYISELSFALKFYHGIAYTIQSDGVRAMEAFGDVIQGVRNGDDALNIAMSQLLKEPITGKTKIHSITEYYKLIMDLLRIYDLPEYLLMIGNKIVEEADEQDPLLPSVYIELFKVHIGTENFNAAMSMIKTNPGHDERTRCLRELISQMLTKKKYKEFVQLDFGSQVPAVSEILEKDCLATFTNWDDPVFQTTFSFYVRRYMMIEAARLYIEYSIRLSTETQTKNLLEKRCNVLSTVIGLMHVVGNNFQFDLVGTVPEPIVRTTEPLIRQVYRMEMSPIKKAEYKVYIRKPTENIEGRLIDLKLMKLEHAKCEARLALTQKYENYSNPPNDPKEIVNQAIKFKLYDMAFTLIMSYDLEPYDLIETVTYECVSLDHDEEELRRELEFRMDQAGDTVGEITKELRRAMVSVEVDKPDWIIENRSYLIYNLDVTVKPYWLILYGYLTLLLKKNPSDTKSIRAATNKCLEYSKPIPQWLLEFHCKQHFGDLLCCLISYDEIDTALGLLETFIDEQAKDVRKNNEKSELLIPFTIIDQLLAYGEMDKRSDETKAKTTMVKNKIINLMKLYSNMVKASTMEARFQ